MGREIDRDTFSHEDEVQFCNKLDAQLGALKERLERPGFSSGPASLGAEVELYIIDKDGCPAALNTELLDAMQSPLLTEELNRFNLEINLSPVSASGTPFTTMQKELAAVLTRLKADAAAFDARIVSIGILPTLSRSDLSREYMTDLPRYRALTNSLTGDKTGAFSLDINAAESLKMQSDELTLEGANTSFQVHLKVPAGRFADYYNAAQLVTPLVMAVSGNSPTFLGKRLWQETRIALFKQCIDDRDTKNSSWRQPARVSFGHGWVHHSAWELFAQNVSLYPPLIPYVFPDSAAFAELCLHHGTVWSWNRAVFDASADGHLRIEFRALPSGPTLTDMMANAAFLTGLTVAYAEKIRGLLPAIPFRYAEYNFYRAAKDGLSANILWPRLKQHGVSESPVRKILPAQLSIAAEGLRQLGVDSAETDAMIRVIEQRLASGQTGAAWQLAQLARYEQKKAVGSPLKAMLQDYIEQSESGLPVGQWRLS
ncbi:hypothetical protein HMF8227_00651 [Saliniradius amylolyticus]|uniref:Glutamate--cysteine ligase n=1 Tax=Saliniradius amylolyticus TaxID=2183582 RepID=A0A2S2E2A4_9ALTE|nr:glutamate--cysteine ligase [Saliniradius amylolyticus]AWL11147.1 hypothetical protein HMF8227_00651 [Saliniradius amylolyticus]